MATAGGPQKVVHDWAPHPVYLLFEKGWTFALCSASVRLFYGSWSSDTSPDFAGKDRVSDPDPDPTHLLAIVSKYDFFKHHITNKIEERLLWT